MYTYIIQHWICRCPCHSKCHCIILFHLRLDSDFISLITANWMTERWHGAKIVVKCNLSWTDSTNAGGSCFWMLLLYLLVTKREQITLWSGKHGLEGEGEGSISERRKVFRKQVAKNFCTSKSSFVWWLCTP